MSRIVLNGYFGFANVGDEALLTAMVEQIRALDRSAELTVLSAQPRETAATLGVEAVNRWHLPSIWKVFRHADLFVSGGGSLLQDATSFRSLAYYATLMLLAHRAGCRVMVYANGLGPLRAARSRRLALRALRRADSITLRDTLSLATLRGLSPSLAQRTELTADPALSLHAASAQEVARLREDLGLMGRRFVVVSLRPWGSFPQSEREMARVIDHIAASGLTPVLLPMHLPGDAEIAHRVLSFCQSTIINPATAVAQRSRLARSLLAAQELSEEGGCADIQPPAGFGSETVPDQADDLATADEANGLAASASPVPIVVEHLLTPALFAGLLGEAELVVSMRLHALILAYARAVPALGVVYDPKVEGFMRDVDLPLGPPWPALTATVVNDQVDQLLAQRDQISEQMQQRLGTLLPRVRRNAQLAVELARREMPHRG